MSDSRPFVDEKLCPGCGRDALHKMCPAWGTPFYMSGVKFTEEIETRWKASEEGSTERINLTQLVDQ